MASDVLFWQILENAFPCGDFLWPPLQPDHTGSDVFICIWNVVAKLVMVEWIEVSSPDINNQLHFRLI
jgi:hypothetical protein